MKHLWAVIMVAFFVSGSVAHALSTLHELTPTNLRTSSPSFAIDSVPLPNGEIQFTVTISGKFPTNFYTTLTNAKITDYPKEDAMKTPAHSIWTEVREPRLLPSQRQQANVIKYVFTVSAKDLENPDLSFVFSMQPEVTWNGRQTQCPP